MTYDRYDRLCAYYRGLRKLINGEKDGLTLQDKFRLLNEAEAVQGIITRVEKVLSIKTEGDWEFSTLAQNYTFWPTYKKPTKTETVLRHWMAVGELEFKREQCIKRLNYMREASRNYRQRIYDNPELHEKHKKKRREYMRERYHRMKK